jgi:hypothetical protein
MRWPVLFASTAFVAPLLAQSPQPSSSQRAAEIKSRPVTLRACVLQGTHGSAGNLSQIEVDPGVSFSEPHRIMYWFYKNLDRFKEHTGHRLEITGTSVAVYEEFLELRATDGVFAEMVVPASGAKPGTVSASGGPSERVGARSSTEVASGEEDAKTVVIKVEIDKVRMLGSCR